MDVMPQIMEGGGTGIILADLIVTFDFGVGDGRERIAVDCSDCGHRVYIYTDFFGHSRRVGLMRYFRNRLTEAIRRGELD